MEDEADFGVVEGRDAGSEDEGGPVCPGCFEPCSPLSYYCEKCGCNEPVNPLASYMPFVDIRFRVGMIGKVWRKTWRRETRLGERVVYIVMFLVFMPVFFVGLPFVLYERVKGGAAELAAGDEGE